MESNYSLSDIAAATNGMDGFAGGNSWVLIILFAMIFGGGGLFGARGDYGNFASAASQQEILYGQRFSNLDNKIDRIGNGIADATYAVTNAITTEGRNAQMQLADCCCTTQRNIDSVRFDMSNYAASIRENDNANTQKILDVLAQNKIESLQGQINQLQLQAALCGVVRYPNQTTYTSGTNPFCNCGNGCCGCANI